MKTFPSDSRFPLIHVMINTSCNYAQTSLCAVSLAKMEEMGEARSSHPCWRELRTVHLGFITCIL